MEFVDSLPIWLLAILIFLFRVADVSLGTVRMLTVVGGMIKTSVFLGFFESLVWLMAAAQVMTRLNESPFLALAFGGGFAAGNGAGIMIERHLAFGHVVIRIIPHNGAGKKIAAALRDIGQPVTCFTGEGRDGPRMMLYLSCPRRKIREIMAVAKALDDQLYYITERASDWRHADGSFFRARDWLRFPKRK